MRRYGKASIRLFQSHDILCFAEIGSISLFVEASDNEAAAHSPCVLTRYEDEREWCIYALDWNIAVDDGHTEGCIVNVNELFQHLMVEGELMYIVDTVRECSH